MISQPDKKTRYLAIWGRKKNYDGVFYVAVKTTGIYCMPSCPVPKALQKNIEFYDSAEETLKNGFRACKYCRPDALNTTIPLRALDQINAGAISVKGVKGLATSLNISVRHLSRIVKAKTGSSPLELNQARRLHDALMLLQKTKLSIIDIAFNCDFASLRQFNDDFKGTFNITPREMRKNFATASTQE
jgi:AraC family transcriptional regulator of adaptative response / DNA-3-methyladenine glycosylase II